MKMLDLNWTYTSNCTQKRYSKPFDVSSKASSSDFSCWLSVLSFWKKKKANSEKSFPLKNTSTYPTWRREKQKGRRCKKPTWLTSCWGCRTGSVRVGGLELELLGSTCLFFPWPGNLKEDDLSKVNSPGRPPFCCKRSAAARACSWVSTASPFPFLLERPLLLLSSEPIPIAAATSADKDGRWFPAGRRRWSFRSATSASEKHEISPPITFASEDDRGAWGDQSSALFSALLRPRKERPKKQLSDLDTKATAGVLIDPNRQNYPFFA